MEHHLTLVASPNYPQTPFFELVDAELLNYPENLQLFKHRDVILPIGTNLSTMREQVTAVVSDCNVRLNDIIGGAIHFAPVKYPELIIGRKSRYNHLYVPNQEGVVSEIIVQSKARHESPSILYQVVATLASSLAYEADAPIEIRVSVRRDGIHVRRDFRSEPEQPPEMGWQELQRRSAEVAHLRGDTLWNRAMAHYHEGLTLTLPVYQFLAFFKGYEDLHELSTNLGKRGYTLAEGRLMLPQDLAKDLPQFHDQSLHRAFENLHTPFRNVAAHKEAKDKKGNRLFVHSDQFDHGQVLYAELAVVAKTCFRELANILRTATPPSA